MATGEREESSVGLVRLYHGTDVGSATDLLHNGLDAGRAAVFNGSGEFWATTDPAMADVFAQVNPAGGQPARFEFDVSPSVLQALLSSVPPAAYQYGNDVYEFLPSSFAVLNREMVNRQVVSPVP